MVSVLYIEAENKNVCKILVLSSFLLLLKAVNCGQKSTATGGDTSHTTLTHYIALFMKTQTQFIL